MSSKAMAVTVGTDRREGKVAADRHAALVLMVCNVPGLALYVVQLAKRHCPGNVDSASIISVLAANAGIVFGAFIRGRVADSRLGLGATPWVDAAMFCTAFLLTLWSGFLDRK